MNLGPTFNRLWAAQAISAFGARITREGLPLMAVVALGAPAATLGGLAATASGAALVTALATGALIDRGRRRRVLIGADLLRAVVLAALPVAALLNVVSLAQVFIAAAIVAAASAVFEMASHAYLPSVVGKDRLVAGNARLAASESVAEVGGPALAGVLFQWLSAPLAIAANALTYLASAAFLAGIRAAEPAPAAPAGRRPWTREVSEGFRVAWSDLRLRALLLMGAAQGLCGGVFSALYVLFASRTLQLSPAQLGLAIAAGGVGALGGTFIAPWLARRLGTGPAILVAMAGAGLAVLITPFALAGPKGLAALIASQVLGDALAVAGVILAASLRQSLAPQAALARLSGAFQATAGGMAVIGALAGGALGAGIGPRAALLAASLGFVGLPLIGLASPLRSVRERT